MGRGAREVPRESGTGARAAGNSVTPVAVAGGRVARPRLRDSTWLRGTV